MALFDRISRLRNRLAAENVDLFKDVNAVVDVNVGGRNMGDKELTKEELERQRAEQLPDREVMSTLNPVIQPMPPVSGDGDLLYPTDPGPKGPPTGGTS
jgi:hypothetical protein